MTTFAFYSTLTFFVVLCVLFALLILVQKGRGGGISSAFGGAGGNTAFGSKTGDVLTWATSVVFAIFLCTCVALNLLAASVDRQQTGKNIVAAPPSAQTDLPAAAPTVAPATTAPAGTPAPMSGTPTTVPASQPAWVPNPIPVN